MSGFQPIEYRKQISYDSPESMWERRKKDSESTTTTKNRTSITIIIVIKILKLYIRKNINNIFTNKSL
jgi:hypothetical protein